MTPRSPRLTVTTLEDRAVPALFTTLYTTQEVDVWTTFTGNAWDIQWANYDNRPAVALTALTDSAIFVPAVARTALPAGAAYSFVGAGAAASAYVLPQVRDTALPWLGVNSLDSLTGALASYQPADARVTTSQPWVRVDVQAVRGPGQFSIYSNPVTGTGAPTVWAASSDGLTSKDSVYVASGKFANYNWAFTAPGVYEVDIAATGYRGANQTGAVTSPTRTLYFSVDPPGPTNTVPTGGVTSTAGRPVIFTVGANSIAVAGPTTSPAPLQTTLTSKNGTLNLGTTQNVGVISGDGSGAVTITGSLAQINAALNGLKYTPKPGYNGVDSVTVLTSDRGEYRPTPNNEQTDSDTFGIVVSGNPAAGSTTPPVVVPPVTFPVGSAQSQPRWLALGSLAGATGTVNVVDAETRETVTTFTPYGANFTGGVRTALADFLKDGTPDVVTAPASGGGPHVQVFDRLGQSPRLSFFAFDPGFTGGVTLALADINGDTVPDIIVGAGAGGGPRVSVFDGVTGAPIRSFFAFESGFRGGVNVAAGDVNGDGVNDIVVGAGPGGGPAVAVFDGKNPANVRRFFAYDPSFRGGVNVAVGDVLGTTPAEIIVGAGAGGGPHIQVYNGVSLAPISSFFAVPLSPTTNNGVGVSVMDFNRDLKPEIVASVPPSGAEPARLRAFDLTAATFRPAGTDVGLTDVFNGGVYVGGLV